MDLSFYKIMHYIGIMALFFAFGGLTLGTLTAGGRGFAHRKIFSIMHGIGLVLLLVSGFGQMARLGIATGWPIWVIIKMIIWLVLGLAVAAIYRAPKANNYLWMILILLGSAAAYLGHLKPI